MHDFKPTIDKYREHLQKDEKNKNANPLKRYFNLNDKLVMLAPFSYSISNEKISGYNDDISF